MLKRFFFLEEKIVTMSVVLLKIIRYDTHEKLLIQQQDRDKILKSSYERHDTQLFGFFFFFTFRFKERFNSRF